LALNKSALTSMNCKTLMVIIAGAGHLFEEVGALEKALAAAEGWYDKHLPAER
jgi:putative phosphoribosyl transferase